MTGICRVIPARVPSEFLGTCMNRKRIFLFIILLVLGLLSFICSLMFGGSGLSASEVFRILFHPHVSESHQMIVWQIRLPRIILGMVVGAGLAACGTTFQGMLRNPLADPFTLGVSGGAALGATLGIALGSAGFALPLFAFGGALVSISLVYVVAGKKRFSTAALILGGVILSFVFSSLVLFIFAISSAEKVHGAVLWLMGDLSSPEPGPIGIVAGAVLGGIALLVIFSRDINILTLGEEKAVHLGLEVESVKKLLFIVASLITGACVAASGIIGFVGLIAPHFIRRFSGPDHRILIPASALGGAILLMLCDCLARTIISPVELPVGVITGIFGGIFFLVFFFRAKKWEIF